MKKKKLEVLGGLLMGLNNLYVIYFVYSLQKELENEGIKDKIKPIVWSLFYAIFLVIEGVLWFDIIQYFIKDGMKAFDIYYDQIMKLLLIILSILFLRIFLNVIFSKNVCNKLIIYADKKGKDMKNYFNYYWKLNFFPIFQFIFLIFFTKFTSDVKYDSISTPMMLIMIILVMYFILYMPYALLYGKINKMVDQKPKQIIEENIELQ